MCLYAEGIVLEVRRRGLKSRKWLKVAEDEMRRASGVRNAKKFLSIPLAARYWSPKPEPHLLTLAPISAMSR
jgi:hypothetical protein